MRVLVLGGGVIGVTTAYYLAKAGHEVELIESQDGPGLATSFANAGQVSPGYASPWAGPGIPIKALKWLMMRHGPLAIRPMLDPALWRWMFSMLGNCTSERYAINKARMVPLAEYSRDCLRELRAETEIFYDHGSGGTLQLFRTQKQLDSIARDVEVLKQFGVDYRVLDPKACVRFEPGLSGAPSNITGGLRLPEDETGDCHIFTAKLAKVAAALGVRFSYGTEVQRIVGDGRSIAEVITSRGRRIADAYVVALGSHSTGLVRPLGLKLPIYPVKGYSLTLPVANDARAPVSTIMDETYKTAITRLGERIRIGGTAELGGFDLNLKAARKAALEHSFNGLFPLGGDTSKAKCWTGLRPMTPDGPPIVGSTPIQGLFLNTGHGTLGWTMACGSARVISDVISGKQPNVAVDELNLSRYQ